jgi:hypothetical protein
VAVEEGVGGEEAPQRRVGVARVGV